MRPEHISILAFSAFCLAGCQHNVVVYTTHQKRVTQAKEAADFLSERYRQLQKEEASLGANHCPFLAKKDKNAAKMVHRLIANAVHPHDGQSAMHVPSQIEIQNTERSLDKLSEAIEKCRNSPEIQTDFKAEKLP